MGEKKVVEIVKELRKFKRRVKNALGVDEIILFGSAAKGTLRKDGDVDLIIVSKRFERKHFVDRGVKLYDYWHLPYPVDFICLSPKEFERMKKEVSIINEALKHGIRV